MWGVLGYKVAWDSKCEFLQRQGGSRRCHRWDGGRVRFSILVLGRREAPPPEGKALLLNEWEFKRFRRVESHRRQELKATEELESMLYSRANETNFKGREMSLKRQSEVGWLAPGFGADTCNPNSGELRQEDCCLNSNSARTARIHNKPLSLRKSHKQTNTQKSIWLKNPEYHNKDLVHECIVLDVCMCFPKKLYCLMIICDTTPPSSPTKDQS